MSANPFEVPLSSELPDLAVSHIKRQDLPTAVREYADNLAAQIKEIYAKYGAKDFEELKENKKLSAQDARRVADLLKAFKEAVEKKRTENGEFLYNFGNLVNVVMDWRVSDDHVYFQQKETGRNYKTLKDGVEIFSCGDGQWDVSDGHFFIIQHQPASFGTGMFSVLTSKILKDGVEAFTGKVKDWRVSDGHAFIEEKQSDGSRKIFKDKVEVFSGQLNHWRVSEGQVYIRLIRSDGTSEIRKDDKELFSGELFDWQVSDGHVFIRQDPDDGQARILKDNVEIFSGKVDEWQVSDGHVFILQAQTDGRSIIFKDNVEIFSGELDGWRCSEKYLFIRQLQPDGSSDFYRLKNPEEV
ncbi:MAG: hypothetical protein WC641_07240 [Patescibacteria group bacterium]